jgi:hypothetical protein
MVAIGLVSTFHAAGIASVGNTGRRKGGLYIRLLLRRTRETFREQQEQKEPKALSLLICRKAKRTDLCGENDF